MPELKLYYKPTCPFCRKVLYYMETRGLEVPLCNVDAARGLREELVRIGGKAQVPCLVIDGKALYESDDIIDWLEENGEKS